MNCYNLVEFCLCFNKVTNLDESLECFKNNVIKNGAVSRIKHSIAGWRDPSKDWIIFFIQNSEVSLLSLQQPIEFIYFGVDFMHALAFHIFKIIYALPAVFYTLYIFHECKSSHHKNAKLWKKNCKIKIQILKHVRPT